MDFGINQLYNYITDKISSLKKNIKCHLDPIVYNTLISINNSTNIFCIKIQNGIWNINDNIDLRHKNDDEIS